MRIRRQKKSQQQQKYSILNASTLFPLQTPPKMSLINNIKQQITEATVGLSTPEYVEFMRELANWAEDAEKRANVAEYEPDFNIDEE